MARTRWQPADDARKRKPQSYPTRPYAFLTTTLSECLHLGHSKIQRSNPGVPAQSAQATFAWHILDTEQPAPDLGRRGRPGSDHRSSTQRRPTMPRDVTRPPKPAPATSLLALAVGAAAFAAVAVGALAIGRLAVGRLTIKKARFRALEVDELTVRKLRVVEHDGPLA